MQKKPNFLLIIADDLGFSDIGCFGGEIHTPNLDKLASQGTRFTNFHTAAACSPTRSMILSGTDNHLVGLGGMIEIRVLPSGEAKYNGRPGHEGFLSTKVATLPEVLRDGGYHTVLTGKWHLGNKDDEMPSARGFDRDWTFAWGAANHYAWEPQFQAGNHDDELWGKMLRGLWTKDHMYAKNGSWINVEPNFPLRPDGYYSSTTFTDQLLNLLAERKSTPSLEAKPFFAYYAFTAPHWPLQAPRDVREKYKGMYDDGPAALRLRRLERLKKLGLVDPSVEPHPVENPMAIQQWEGMSAENKAKSARAMETYAAMVEMIDRNVGRVVDQLERDGELDNTVVIFMSDNGAEGGALESAPITGTSVSNIMTKFHDNSLDNIGEPNSFVWYGPFWAQAATAPGRLFKMCSSQGGIRVPFLVRMPPALLSSLPDGPASTFQPGGISHEFATCRDLMPTFLDLSGAKHPVPGPERGTYKGREGVLPMTGKSWVPWLQGNEAHVHGDDEEIGWELHGRAAFRKGNWKILFMPPPYGKGQWELYDIQKDQGEVNDLADTHPEIVKEMLTGWDEYVIGKGVLWGLGGDPDPTSNPNLMQDETLDPEGWMNTAKMA